MTAYLEFHLKGNGRGFIEAGSIAGVISGKNTTIWSRGVTESPVIVIMRGGATMEVIGEAAGHIIARALMSRQKVRQEALDVYIDYLTPMEAPDGASVEK